VKSLLLASLLFICSLGLFGQELKNLNSRVRTSSINNSSINADSLTLPVELIYFFASIQQKGVLLNWGTATEVNNFGFEIERAYSKTENWETVDFVLGSGTSNIPINYEYQDTTVLRNGIVYYRLKQVDIIGDFEYSDTISVDFLSSIILENPGTPQEFLISDNFPNPFNPSTKINFSFPVMQLVTISLYDINGKLVKELASGEFLPGSYSLSIDFSNYSSGIYFVRFQSNNFSVTRRLVYLK
jgi:hypothetical protein